MIRVYRKEEDGPHLDVWCGKDPVKAEAHYLRLCQTRTDGPGLVHIVAPRSMEILVPRASYRTDSNWYQDENGDPPREIERVRYLQLWAKPERGWTGPTTHQLRAALQLAGLTQVGFARAIGVSSRSVRYWAAGERPIDWPSWAILLSWAGHPVFCSKASTAYS